MTKIKDDNLVITEQKVFWLDEGETVEDVLGQIKEWLHSKPALKGSYNVAVFGKTTFDEILKYIEELKQDNNQK